LKKSITGCLVQKLLRERNLAQVQEAKMKQDILIVIVVFIAASFAIGLGTLIGWMIWGL